MYVCIFLHMIMDTSTMCLVVTVGSMNNLNDPPRWNIDPDPGERRAGGGNGNPWNYALLIPMLGLAAFRKHISKCIFVNVEIHEIQKKRDE